MTPSECQLLRSRPKPPLTNTVMWNKDPKKLAVIVLSKYLNKELYFYVFLNAHKTTSISYCNQQRPLFFRKLQLNCTWKTFSWQKIIIGLLSICLGLVSIVSRLVLDLLVFDRGLFSESMVFGLGLDPIVSVLVLVLDLLVFVLGRNSICTWTCLGLDSIVF